LATFRHHDPGGCKVIIDSRYLKGYCAGIPVSITFIGRENEPFQGVVESLAWGIYDSDGSTAGDNLLPSVSQTVDWVRLPNRFPVRIQVTGQTPIPLRIGQTVSIATTGE